MLTQEQYASRCYQVNLTKQPNRSGFGIDAAVCHVVGSQKYPSETDKAVYVMPQFFFFVS